MTDYKKVGYGVKKKLRRQLNRAFVSGIIIGGSAVFVFFLVLSVMNMDVSGKKEGEYQAYLHSVEITEKENAENSDFLVLVNWNNPVPYDRPDDLVMLSDIFGDEVIVVNGEGSINKTAGEAAKDMFEAALSEGVGRYKITGAYRSTIYQDKLWEEKKAEDPDYGSNPFASPVKVMPGNMSEHSTGLAIDILCESYDTANAGYGGTEEGMWLYENAHKYGFILRYPEDKEHITGVIYEPWHYRYVGVSAATEIRSRGMCLEEYLGEYG